jgi:hypothetical protein
MSGHERTDAEKLEDMHEWATRFAKFTEGYDGGEEFHAKDLANHLRQILSNKHNVLSALDINRESFQYQSTPPNNATFRLARSAGSAVWIPGEGTKEIETSYHPTFHMFKGNWNREPYKDWWEGAIDVGIVPPFTRKEIVMTVAEKDGGAHVDPTLPRAYADMRRQKDLGIEISTSDKKASPERGRQYAIIRQITYEVQLTLNREIPTYLPRPFSAEIHSRFPRPHF